MKRATITIPDDLEQELNAYLERQEMPTPLTSLIQTALRAFLKEQKWKERDYRAPQTKLDVPISKSGSGLGNISVDHDEFLSK